MVLKTKASIISIHIDFGVINDFGRSVMKKEAHPVGDIT